MSDQGRKTIDDSKNTMQGAKVKTGRDLKIGDTIINLNVNYVFVSISIMMALVFMFLINKGSFEHMGFNESPLLGELEDTQAQGEPIEEPVETTKLNIEGGSKQIKKPKSTEDTSSPSKKTDPTMVSNQLKVTDYVNAIQGVDLAFLPSKGQELESLQAMIRQQISATNTKTSRTLFRPAFFSNFGSSLEELDFGALSNIQLPSRVNCICQIEEDIKITEESVEEIPIWTATGSVKIEVYNFKSDNYSEIILEAVPRAGATRSSALNNLEEYLMDSEELKRINISNCK